MAGRIIKAVSQTISAVSGAALTVSSTAGFFEGAYGYLRKTGQPGATVRVSRILSATQLEVREVKDPRGSEGTIQADTNYQPMNATAYVTTGVISLPEQLVYNPNDEPLP